jgi:putative protease
MSNKVELLSPAGDYESLQMAIAYGADAVYIGAPDFSLRTNAENFMEQDIENAIALAKRHGVKLYVALNAIVRNKDLPAVTELLGQIRRWGAHAVIVSDPGVAVLARHHAPEVELHISTQANCMNYESARAWRQIGATRIILARELGLEEIKEIKNCLPDVELEVFVHGSICISHSGRCYLSMYTTQRDANYGDCAHSCRWKYALVEEKRPNEYFPVFEDDTGAYIMNSRDLCLIEHLHELVDAGVDSFKIEGRGKSSYYVASATQAYRMSLDRLYSGRYPDDYFAQGLQELQKTSHRPFFTGFLKGVPQSGQYLPSSANIQTWRLLAVCLQVDLVSKTALCSVKNQIHLGDEVEFLIPGCEPCCFRVEKLQDQDGTAITKAVHPQMLIRIPCPDHVRPLSILRRALSDRE